MPEYLPTSYVDFRSSYRDIAAAIDTLGASVDAAGDLDERTLRLVKLGIAIGVQSEGAARSNVRKAIAAGVTEVELRQVALSAITTTGFPAAIAALGWIDDVVGATPHNPPTGGE